MSNRDLQNRRSRRTATVMCAALMLVVACGTPTSPSVEVIGAWDFTFSAFEQRSCPGNGALVRGCAGSGLLEFLGTTPAVDATHSYRASCQSCERAADYGVGGQPLRTARLAGRVLEFTLAACRFTATVPEAHAQTVVGTAICAPDQATGPEISGSWTMSRR